VANTAAINFNPSFGKICLGEYFKVLFTIQNNSANYDLEGLHLKSSITRISKKDPEAGVPPVTHKEQILQQTNIPILGPKE
jgi:hypothetical protein